MISIKEVLFFFQSFPKQCCFVTKTLEMLFFLIDICLEGNQLSLSTSV